MVQCGISTNIGVECTARFAYEYGDNEILVEDAMSGLSAEEHAATVTKVFPRIGLVRKTDEILADVKLQLAVSFGDGDITLKLNKKELSLMVEVALPEGGQFNSEIKVGPVAAADSEEQEVTLKFVPFPVCLPGDKALVWLLAKRENLTPEEAGIALPELEEEFWASKTGRS